MNPLKLPRAGIAGVAAIGFALSALATGSAAAERCLDDVVQLAKHHNISTDPPTVPPDKPADVTPRELGRSGGVVEPPPVRDKSVIEPPAAGSSKMPTMPDVATRRDSAADCTTLQAALVAARSEAERGNEKGCREALGRAAQVLERTH
jgi:hypothetical protein